MANIRACLDPTPPVLECSSTAIFGAPRGRIGRALQSDPMVPIPVSGIAIHCVKDTYDGYLAKVCIGAKVTPECHASFHYVIDAETGAVTSLVDETNLAWAWQSYRSNFPVTSPVDGCPCAPPCPTPPCPVPPAPTTYPGWTVLSALFPNLSADFYTVNIGVTSPNRPEQQILDGVDCCAGPWGLSPAAYANLVRLIAWIQSRYPAITVDAQHIAFHDDIIETICPECPCGANGSCLVCDVSSYCEACITVSDPAMFESTNVRFVYGESDTGCRVKILLTDLKVLLDALP